MMMIVKLNNPNTSFVDDAYGVSRTTNCDCILLVSALYFCYKKETIEVSFVI